MLVDGVSSSPASAATAVRGGGTAEQPAFGLRLRALRLERGLSQAALAEGGMSTSYLSRLESGARPPTERVVEHLAKRLGVEPSAFGEAAAPSLSQILAAVTSAASDEDLAEILTDALRQGGQLDPGLRSQALWLLSEMHGGQGQYELQHGLLVQLRELSDELGSPELRVRARTRLSHCVRQLGDTTKARQHAHEAHNLAAGLSVADQAGALRALVSAEAEAGLLTDAGAHADDLRTLTEHSPAALHVEALWASATVRIRQSDYVAAQRLLEQALDMGQSRDDLLLWLRLRLAAVSLYLQITPALTDRARARLDEVSAVVDLIGSDLHRQQALALRAHLAFEEGDVAQARRLWEQLDEQPLLLTFRDRIRFRALHGQLLILAGQVAEGTRALEELAKQAQEALSAELAADIWRTLARMLVEARGDAAAR